MALQKAKSEALPERQTEPIPIYVKIALLVILNHVEPGWENCTEVVREWVDSLPKDTDRLKSKQCENDLEQKLNQNETM